MLAGAASLSWWAYQILKWSCILVGITSGIFVGYQVARPVIAMYNTPYEAVEAAYTFAIKPYHAPMELMHQQIANAKPFFHNLTCGHFKTSALLPAATWMLEGQCKGEIPFVIITFL